MAALTGLAPLRPRGARPGRLFRSERPCAPAVPICRIGEGEHKGFGLTTVASPRHGSERLLSRVRVPGSRSSGTICSLLQTVPRWRLRWQQGAYAQPASRFNTWRKPCCHAAPQDRLSTCRARLEAAQHKKSIRWTPAGILTPAGLASDRAASAVNTARCKELLFLARYATGAVARAWNGYNQRVTRRV